MLIMYFLSKILASSSLPAIPEGVTSMDGEAMVLLPTGSDTVCFPSMFSAVHIRKSFTQKKSLLKPVEQLLSLLSDLDIDCPDPVIQGLVGDLNQSIHPHHLTGVIQ